MFITPVKEFLVLRLCKRLSFDEEGAGQKHSLRHDDEELCGVNVSVQLGWLNKGPGWRAESAAELG